MRCLLILSLAASSCHAAWLNRPAALVSPAHNGPRSITTSSRPSSQWARANRIISSTALNYANKNKNNKGGVFNENAGQQNSTMPTSSTATKASIASNWPAYSTDDANTAVLDYDAESADPGSLKLNELYDTVSSSPKGLQSVEASSRLEQYGPNALEKPPSKSTWQLILEQFDDRLVQILLVVAVMSGVFSFFEVQEALSTGGGNGEAWWKSFVEPMVILAILVINAAVGVWQAQSASDSLEALQKMQPTLATVLRDGEWQNDMDAATLVPGDVFEIRVGDKIPADSRLLNLQSSSLQVDEGSLTGESVTVGKLPGNEGTVAADSPIQDQRGMLYSGTMVTRGTGRAMVVQTGMDTQFGKIQKGVTEAKEDEMKTPLAIKLDEFGEQLTTIIGAICAIVWLVSIPKFNDASFSSIWEGAIYYAKVAVALGVAAIPEGLPAVITLCLSLGTRRMAERNVIVRKLQSVETLGCTTVICTDKTGTLTTNEMTAVSMFALDDAKTISEHAIDGYSYSPVGGIEGITKHQDLQKNPQGSLADIAAVSALCNDAKIVGNDDSMTIEADSATKDKGAKLSVDTEKAYSRIGEPTEAALCVLAEKLGGMYNDVDADSSDAPPSTLASASVNSWRKHHPRKATLEFSRDRKSMSVLSTTEAGDNRLLVKGAPNLLLERCTHVKFRDGTVQKMTAETRRQIDQYISDMAARPLRCLALAVKEKEDLPASLQNFEPKNERDIANHPLLSNPASYKEVESGLTFVGVVGIKDPARPGVAESIEVCTKAGIRVLMITGDAKDTAVAIAKDVNIFNDHTANYPYNGIRAFEGREFFNKPEEEQLRIIDEGGNIVFCRAEPADKQKLVKMLQSRNEIPAMTGDGVNDAPALQQAAIGVAMGITGTEVSKEASDMIIADDNFSTIVNAVEEGRCIYANMQSFICFLISCNIGEICAIFFATLAGFPEPLTAMHLLWVNLVTDGPPATALGFNPPPPDIMDKPPRPTDQPILTKWLLTRYMLTGLYVGFATIAVFAGHYLDQGITLSQLSHWSQCGDLWSPPGGLMCSDLVMGDGRALPQTLALTTLVCIEMTKALSAVSLDNSITKVGPQSNPWLMVGVAGPMALHIFVLYSSMFGLPDVADSLGLVPLTMNDWIHVLQWSLPMLLVDETLKFVGRRLDRREQEKQAAAAAAAEPTP